MAKKRKSKKRSDPLYFTIPIEEIGHYVGMLRGMFAEGKVEGLVKYLSENFSTTSLNEMFARYRIGVCDKKTMIFPYIDVEGRLRALKRIKYGVDGKRCKNGQKSVGLGYICSSLKEQAIIPAGWKMKLCLFGEHLLNESPEAPVVIVESEKTAMVCSMCFPQYVWLATGGCGQFKPIVWIRQLLSTRRVLLFPDTGEYEAWSREAKRHSIKCLVADYLESEKMAWNTDLADLLLGESMEFYLNEVQAYLDRMINVS